MRKIICNVCGKEFNSFDDNNAISLYATACFGSKYDGEHINADICIDCFDKFVDECKISPVINCGIANDEMFPL